MRRRGWVAMGVSGALVVGALVTLRAEDRPAVSHCAACHKAAGVKVKYIQHTLEDWERSPHAKAGVGCESCHGGRPDQTDPMKAHEGIRRSTEKSSPVYYRNLPETCGQCHSEEQKAFSKSAHFRVLQRTGKGPTCTTCHGTMAATVLSPKALEQTCNLCHKKPVGAQETLLIMNQSAELFRVAEEAVADTKTKGGDVAPLEKDIQEGRKGLQEAAREWHTFNLNEVKRHAIQVFEKAKSVRAKVRKP